MEQTTKPEGELPPIEPDYTESMTAPLVHLVKTDPTKLSKEELQIYLKELREVRGNPGTARNKTERINRKGEIKTERLSSLL